jgi:hypothetical protein
LNGYLYMCIASFRCRPTPPSTSYSR